MQLVKEQLVKLDKKNNECQLQLDKKDETIGSLKRQIINYKKQVTEITYQWKTSMASTSRLQEQVKKLNDELKAKGTLILTLEKERRKLNNELLTIKSSGQSNDFRRGRELTRAPSNNNSPGHRRSSSVDRLSDTRRQLGRQLLTANQGQAYTVSKRESSIESIEKLVLLQKMLLAKSKCLAEKEVTIEELNNQITDLKVQLTRLSKARHLAQELTSTRHKLALMTHQLDQVKAQLEQSKLEVEKLKEKDKRKETLLMASETMPK